jgi:Glycosyl transferase family 1
MLYGVNGEGMGHATRSQVVIDALLDRHDVRVVASGAAFRYLTDRLPRVREVFGPTFAMGEGQIRRWENVRLGGRELPEAVRLWMAEVSAWRPDVVISDFEPLSGRFARLTRAPLLAVDNINMLDRGRHDREIVGRERDDFLLARAITRSMVPGALEYIVTTSYRPRLARGRGRRSYRRSCARRSRRPAPSAATTSSSTRAARSVPSTRCGRAASAASSSGCGASRGRCAATATSSSTRRPTRASSGPSGRHGPSSPGCGFSLMSEAVYLRKPLLAIPLRGQFEQLMDARYLERSGFGMFAPRLSRATLEAFLERGPEFEKALDGYEQKGNAVALETIEDTAMQVAGEPQRERRRARREARRRAR